MLKKYHIPKWIVAMLGGLLALSLLSHHAGGLNHYMPGFTVVLDRKTVESLRPGEYLTLELVDDGVRTFEVGRSYKVHQVGKTLVVPSSITSWSFKQIVDEQGKQLGFGQRPMVQFQSIGLSVGSGGTPARTISFGGR